jgi:hypothetical protein
MSVFDLKAWQHRRTSALGRFSPFLYATQALSVSRGIALLFSKTFDTRWGVEDQPHAPAVSTPGKDPVPIVQEAGWGPRAGLHGRKISSPTGVRSRTFQPVVSRYTD